MSKPAVTARLHSRNPERREFKVKNLHTTAVVVVSVLSGIMADRLVVGTAVRAQEASRLSIGGETVSLGMPKDTVLAKFAGKYGTLDLHDGRVSIVHSGTEPNVVRGVGEFTFEAGRLKSATRYWGDFWDGTDDKMEPLWNALRGALAQQVGARRLTVEIESLSNEQPNSHQEWILLHFPKEDIEIGEHRLRVNNRDGINFYVRETVF